jgi:hypothetical protein
MRKPHAVVEPIAMPARIVNIVKTAARTGAHAAFANDNIKNREISLFY